MTEIRTHFGNQGKQLKTPEPQRAPLSVTDAGDDLVPHAGKPAKHVPIRKASKVQRRKKEKHQTLGSRIPREDEL